MACCLTRARSDIAYPRRNCDRRQLDINIAHSKAPLRSTYGRLSSKWPKPSASACRELESEFDRLTDRQADQCCPDWGEDRNPDQLYVRLVRVNDRYLPASYRRVLLLSRIDSGSCGDLQQSRHHAEDWGLRKWQNRPMRDPRRRCRSNAATGTSFRGVYLSPIPGCVERVERDFEVTSTVVLGRGKPTPSDIHLQRLQDQRGHGQTAVAPFT
jgi:hypothetical protein